MAASGTRPLAASAVGFYASGSAAVAGSGVIAASGPWMIEKQTMDIAYTRVPTGFMNTFALTLSSVSMGHYINRTVLECIISVSYSKIKSYDSFVPASYQQPQTFEINGQQFDQNGNSYGNLTGSSMGPAGVVNTKQPWISRRAWEDSIDVETTSSVTVANFASFVSGPGYFTTQSKDQTQNQDFDQVFLGAEFKGSPLYDWAIQTIVPYGATYPIPGAYDPAKETLLQAIAFIENVAMKVQAETFLDIPAQLTPGGQYGSPFVHDKGLSDYDPSKHDYSNNFQS